MARLTPRADARIDALIDRLTTQGSLTHQAWRTALRVVPRHLFVPRQAWVNVEGRGAVSRPINRDTNADDWWNGCYEIASVITQRDDGDTPADSPTGTPTCSLSSPGISIPYLELLDPANHHHVLEIGAGTGWTAAALAWKLGADQVTTIEVDETLAKLAEENIRAAGFEPRVIAGDGALGYPEGGPYDRVHVTCGIRDIPYTWIEQCRPGGQIVLPWMPHPGQWGQRLRLDVLDDETAVGAFVGGGGFMMLRSQRATVPDVPEDGGRISATWFDPHSLGTEGLQLALVTQAPGLAWVDTGFRDGALWRHQTTLWDLAGDSVATCTQQGVGVEYEAVQHGPRDLWDEAQAAYMWWARNGRPGRDRYQMTVTPEGQKVTYNR